ncbi:MAG: type II toxin-antitoxin system PemK/MazF family toxin [Candidatus Aminicenantes bacterium]|nr:type II toxin-antitoxin system PemK/MazF family toxin [Candidatus Aminicenantes bacterium]
MKIEKFHIYLADLNPQFGTEPGKIRPVIVIQTDMLNQVHPSTIVLPVTTKVIKEASILRVHIEKEESNLKEDSDILIDQVRAIDKRRFIKHIGELSEEHKQQIIENLKIIILE